MEAMKTIQLTVYELKRLIHDCIDSMMISEKKGENKTYNEVIDYSLYNKGYINEMALRKKDYVNLLLDLKDHLIENWCLCAFCSLFDRLNENFDHWRVEFMSYANKIKRCNLKSGDKQKVIFDIYINKFDLNSSKMIYYIIRGKFNKEQIDDELAISISEICSQNAYQLVKFLSNDNYEAEEYLMRTFNKSL